jgi:hypothetical protein
MNRIKLSDLVDLFDESECSYSVYEFSGHYMNLLARYSDDEKCVSVARVIEVLSNDLYEFDDDEEVAYQNKFIENVTDKLFELYPDVFKEIFSDKYPMLDYYGLSSDNFEILE